MTAKRRQPTAPTLATSSGEPSTPTCPDPEVPTLSWVWQAADASPERARRDAVYEKYLMARCPADEAKTVAGDRTSAKVYQMQLWPDDKRAMPSDFIACALFAAVQMRHARPLRGEQVASINGFTIKVTGHRLTQVHADVLMGIAQLARQEPAGYIARFSHRQFLRLIGREHGSNSLKSLRQLLDDLATTVIRITYPDGRSLFGHVLEKGADDGAADDSQFAVVVTRELCQLFAGGFALVDWQQRRLLKHKPLALWLQLYVSQFHRPVALRELQRLSGSTDELRFFRRRVKQELETLRALGTIQQFYLDNNDILHIARPGAPLPERFLTATRSTESSTPSGSTSSPAPHHLPVVTDTAKAKFRALYPQHDADKCLADWRSWKGSREAKNPDAQWLAFAKTWTTDQR